MSVPSLVMAVWLTLGVGELEARLWPQRDWAWLLMESKEDSGSFIDARSHPALSVLGANPDSVEQVGRFVEIRLDPTEARDRVWAQAMRDTLDSLSGVVTAKVFAFPRRQRVWPFDKYLDVSAEIVYLPEASLSLSCTNEVESERPWLGFDRYGRPRLVGEQSLGDSCRVEVERWLHEWWCFPGQVGDDREPDSRWTLQAPHPWSGSERTRQRH